MDIWTLKQIPLPLHNGTLSSDLWKLQSWKIKYILLLAVSSLMAQWLEWPSQGNETMLCHDLWVIVSNPGGVELKWMSCHPKSVLHLMVGEPGLPGNAVEAQQQQQ